MKKFILLLILQLLFSHEVYAQKFTKYGKFGDNPDFDFFQQFKEYGKVGDIFSLIRLNQMLDERFKDCTGRSLLRGNPVDVSDLFVPHEFEYLRFLSNRNSLSFEEGVEAIKELPHTIPQLRQGTVSSDNFVEKWQALYNRVHNRLYIRTQMARLNQDIALLQGQIGGGLYESNEDEKRRVLALKTEELETYQDIVDVNIDQELLGDGIFSTLQNTPYGKMMAIRRDRREKRLQRNCETRKEVTQLNLVVSYIESLPPDMRTWEQEKELEWALSALWMYETPRENARFDFNDRLQVIEQKYDYRIASTNIGVDLDPLKARIAEDYMILDVERVLRFIDLNTGIPFIQDRLFGSLIQTSSVAHTLAQGDWEIEPLSVPEWRFLSSLGITDKQTQSEFVDLSSFYGPVKSQGKSKACFGFSIADDIYFELNQKGAIQGHEFLSPFSVYRSLQYYNHERQPLHCLAEHSQAQTLYNGRALGDRGVDVNFLFENSNDFFQLSFCVMNDWYDPYVLSKARVTDYETYTQRISFELIRVLLENNKPPILLLNTDSKRVTENWQEVIPSDEPLGHSIIVVGYGMQDVNPFTLKREPYFIVRDSLTEELIHYKVSAENLLEFTHGLVKITGVERI